MNAIVVTLVIFLTPVSCEADNSDLYDCSYYVHQLSDEEVLEYMRHYEYISMIDDMEKEVKLFDTIYEADIN